MSKVMMEYEVWTVRKWVFHEPEGTDPDGYFVYELADTSENRARARFYKLRDEGEYAELTKRTIVETVEEETHETMPLGM